MIFCIFADASCERGNVLIAMSLPFARTEICALFACITQPSNLSSPVSLGLGFTAALMMGAAVSTTMIAPVDRPCADAGAGKQPPAARISRHPAPADLL